jgi:hypothetical protein
MTSIKMWLYLFNIFLYGMQGLSHTHSEADDPDEYGEIIGNPLEFLQKLRVPSSGNSMNSTGKFSHILRIGVHIDTMGFSSTGSQP